MAEKKAGRVDGVEKVNGVEEMQSTRVERSTCWKNAGRFDGVEMLTGWKACRDS